MSKLVITCAAVALSACAIDDTTDTAETLQPAIGGTCPSWGCPDNSPVMGPYSFWEIDITGATNADGIKFGDFVLGGVHYKPVIAGDVFTACNAGACRSGKQLETGYFEVFTPKGMYKLVIKTVRLKATSNVYFWVGPVQSVETYELNYVTPGNPGPGEPVCTNPPNDRNAGENNSRAVWNAPLESVLFTGDRYDARTRTVTTIDPVKTRGIINIGCAGSSIAKMHFNRYTTAGASGSFVTSINQRSALLQMYASFICGKVFTVKGTPLSFADSFRTLSGSEFAYEARWNETGPLCLDTHRLGSAVISDIYATCNAIGKSLPACHGSVTAPGLSGALIVSAVPFAVP